MPRRKEDKLLKVRNLVRERNNLFELFMKCTAHGILDEAESIAKKIYSTQKEISSLCKIKGILETNDIKEFEKGVIL